MKADAMRVDAKSADIMKAILVREAGGPEVLHAGEAPMPSPASNEVLVRVAATALNRADVMQRRGKYPPPPGASPILGLEMSGEVVSVGPNVEQLVTGDRVCGLLAGGGYAEYVAIREDHCLLLPDRMSFEEAAAVPEVFLTAYQGLHWLGKATAGEVALIHAGASGVGTAAIQLAKNAGLTVIVTASAGKHDLCMSLGASHAIDYRSEDFSERSLSITSGNGADVIIDFIGAPYLTKNLRAAAFDARIVLLAMMGGSNVESLNLRDLFRKRISLIASTLRNRSDQYKASLTADFAAHAMPLFDTGVLKPVIDSIVSVRDAGSAHERMESNENAGKIVMRLDW